ncbi:4Fe-4S binding protein [Geoglobus acetivorans]|uniref:4Fe-4S binding protein n=1 Tax=Geoglobus acetivorans TaxID=565033 RepID=A0A0A7GFD6_GEOAI|nr:putative polyferredoxin [Geoglobus acetivorans]MBE8539157.1 4Fe-4S binding protein [Geoglobus acetivorans]
MSNYLERGYLEREDLPPFPPEERLTSGKPVAYIECVQPIPCSPCYESCRFDAIQMDNINDPPKLDYEKCTGCMACIRVCPGLAIFMLQIKDGKGYVTIQYEFLPWLQKGDRVKLYNRKGEEVGEGTVTWALNPERNDRTQLVTIEMNKDLIYEVRAVRKR